MPAGQTLMLAVLTLTVAPSPLPATAAHPARHPTRASHGGGQHRAPDRPRSVNRRRAAHGPRAHLASGASDTIADFQFAPATITIHLGGTVTWLNDGPASHTATALDGSFDTGTLQKGQSGSHTFTQAGTFAYHCTIHPFMHGTVVVSGAPSPATPTHGTSAGVSVATTVSSGTSAGSGQGSAGAPTLPRTGTDLAAPLISGLLLLGGGLLLRRRIAAH